MKRVRFSALLLAILLLPALAFAAGSWDQINQQLDKPEGWAQLVQDSPFALGEDTALPDGKGGTFLERGFGTYPSIDGSTVAVPMAMEFARQHLGLSEVDLPGFVAFSTTHSAYKNLIGRKPNGSATLVTEGAVMDSARPVDLIIATYPSDEELAMAEAAGVELIIEAVCYDAFVFITHKDNPVENLTVQQIRDIYSGKIMNWSEVGGPDSRIKPYQRPRNSGSQTAMELLVMQDTPLFAVGANYYSANDMSALVEHIGGFSGGVDALGYTYQYYIDELYKDASIKTIAVDGVEPTEENLRSGSYPFTTHYYAVIRAEDQDGLAGQFLAWMRSDEGQACIAQAGYIPQRQARQARQVTAGGLEYLLSQEDAAIIVGVEKGVRSVVVPPFFMGRQTMADAEADFTGIETLIFGKGIASLGAYQALLEADTVRRIELPDGFEVGEDYYGPFWNLLFSAPHVDTVRIPASMTAEEVGKFATSAAQVYDYALYTLQDMASEYYHEDDFYYYDPLYDQSSCRALSRIEVDPANEALYDIDGVVFERNTDTLFWCPPGRMGSYAVPEGTTRIDRAAFSSCDMLESITIPRSVTEIDTGAFQYCAGLRTVQLPPTLKSIGERAFIDCVSLEQLVIPEGVTVADGAFDYCIGLRALYFMGKGAAVDAGALLLTHPDLVVYAPDGSDAQRAAAVARLAWTEMGGTPQRLEDPTIMYRQPAIVKHAVALYEAADSDAKPIIELTAGTTVNVLGSEAGWAHCWLPEAEGYIPLENLHLQQDADEMEKILSAEVINKDAKIYEAPSLAAAYRLPANSREWFDVIQRFGTWYVLSDAEGVISYIPVHMAQPESMGVSANGIVVAASPDEAGCATVYREADTGSEALAVLFNGTQMEAMEYVPDANGVYYWQVRVGDLVGYMESSNIRYVWNVWFSYAW